MVASYLPWSNSADSLRLYRRLGAREMVSWVDAAEQAHVDTLQQTNVPAVDSCEAFGFLLHENERDVVARENAVRNLLEVPRGRKRAPRTHASDDDDAAEDDPDTAPQPPPSDTTPLTAATAEGRWVLVPRAAWPDYPCAERDGAGWEAVVGKVVRGVARVHFLHAMTSRGVPYADVDLSIDALVPL